MRNKSITFLILFSIVCPINVPVSVNSELNFNIVLKE
ncbi:hypothetical protein SAMN05421731_101807 [Acinetobacter puyangensis]|uniref:Uncharacterized protein n=1 Tax=Acinetobacter puyangensis TaxID=1096779 RepID=A0A240E683_9GAMM|nr:hypothetical protein SAMN05421731_101807 [Acinetobacter puyangensis]